MKNDELRNATVALEEYPEDLKNGIRDEMTRLREHPLKTWEKVFLVFWCIPVGFLMMGLAFLHGALWDGDSISRLGIVACFVFGGGLVVFSGMALKTGKMQVQRTSAFVRAATGFAVLWICTAMVTGKSCTENDLAGLMVIGGAALWNRIERAELRVRECVLRAQLPLTEQHEFIVPRK